MTSKVLWGEGLFLRPHHFQQQDQYHEHRLQQCVGLLQPYAWGVRHLRIDQEALASNVLRILELSLRFQDGELYEAPGVGTPGGARPGVAPPGGAADGAMATVADDLPAPVDLGALPSSVQSVTYHAALPAFKPYGGNFLALHDGAPAAPQAQGANAPRYTQHDRDTADLYTGAAQEQLAYLKKTVRLVADFEPRASYVNFPLLRLQRAATGGFELDPGFMPPSTSIGASPVLFQQLRRLLDALQAKVAALCGHHADAGRQAVEFRPGDMASYWLLHTASSACAALAHYAHHPSLHPERLYEQLLGVAGALMTFSRNWTLAELQPYQHDDPGPSFSRLLHIIRDLLDTVISSRYFPIALNEVRPSYWLGQLDSGKIDERTVFYIAVSAALPALELVDVVPRRFKLGAPDDVEKCVLAALPGVRLQHAPQLPAAVPVRPDACYFMLDTRGPMAERMLQAQSISIYVPSGIQELRLELMGLSA